MFKGMTYYNVELDTIEERDFFLTLLKKNLCPVLSIKNLCVECLIIDYREEKIERALDEYNDLI